MRVIFLIFILATVLAQAAQPEKAPLARYTQLWMESPFTSKPIPPEAGPVFNPLEDYALGGVSPILGGYRVTLLSKKTPGERIIVDSDNPNARFKIVSVQRAPSDPMGTVVHLTTQAGMSGSVAYQEELLTLNTAAAQVAPPQPVPADAPPGFNPQNLGANAPQGVAPQRPLRPRIIIPDPPNGVPNPAAQQVPMPVQDPAQNVRPARRP